MRTIRNLTWFLLAFGLTVWAGIASAADSYYRAGTDSSSPYRATTAAAACQKFATAEGWTFASVSGTYCQGRKPPSFPNNMAFVYVGRFTCPAAKPYFSEKLGDCAALADPPPPRCDVPQGTKFRFTVFRGSGSVNKELPDNSTVPPYPNSSPKCYLQDLPDVTRCYSETVGTKKNYYCEYEGVSDGNPVADGQGPMEAAPPTPDKPRVDHPPTEAPDGGPCPKGTVNAGLSASGIPMCVGSGTDPKNKPPAPPKIETEKTETAEDGTKTTTKTETIKNADGTETKTTTVTIVKPDGTKSTNQDKTTTNKPDGSPGKDDSSKEDEKYDLCKQNPNLTICRNSTVSGKCGEISCTGDAIQCATLRAAAAMQCKQQQDADELAKSPLTGLGQQILGGADPAKSEIDSMLKGTDIDMSKPQLDASGFLGAGACFAPISVNVGGHTMTASFDYICDVIDPLRYLVLALAYVAAYLIVARSVTGGN
jgi:hypothetical protein